MMSSNPDKLRGEQLKEEDQKEEKPPRTPEGFAQPELAKTDSTAEKEALPLETGQLPTAQGPSPRRPSS